MRFHSPICQRAGMKWTRLNSVSVQEPRSLPVLCVHVLVLESGVIDDPLYSSKTAAVAEMPQG